MIRNSNKEIVASMRAGAIAVFGFAATGTLFGILFGIAATSAGVTIIQAVLMSAAMFSAAGQFAALEFWQTPLPYATLALSTLLICSRLALLSIALVPYITKGPLTARVAGLSLLLDPNAIMVMNLNDRHDPFAFFVGGGIILYVMWILGAFIGATFTNILTADIIVTLQYAGVLFIGMIMTAISRANGKHWLPWMISGLTAGTMSLAQLPSEAIMIVSVLAGIITGIVKAKYSNA